MTHQLALVPPEPPKLTPRQQAAFDYIRDHDGVPADELGAHWHELRGKHPVGDRCRWCEGEGKSIVRTRALRELVTYRRTPEGRLYVLRGTKPAAPVRSGTGYDPATAEMPF